MVAPINMPVGYKFRIELLSIKPTIWREFTVSANSTLDQFHLMLQAVMGWENVHMHQFRVGKIKYGVPDPYFPEDKITPEDTVNLVEIFGGRKKKILYEYDFGDGWEHAVKCLGMVKEIEGLLRVLDGARACPPEDCGGPHGYPEFLDALYDPDHENHESVFEWVGEEFDPDLFDRNECEEMLQNWQDLE